MILHLNPTKLDRDYLATRPYKAVPIVADFWTTIVNKPWGKEYLMYRNQQVEVWNLFINQGKATSMHCHPNKKTALVILDGKAQFSSLNESVELSPMCAVIMEPNVFHSTQAISSAGVKLLEFETPPMKHDLVRLEDKYGRVNEGYEGPEKITPHKDLARFAVIDTNVVKNICDSNMCIKPINCAEDVIGIVNEINDLAVVLSGSIVSKHGDVLCGPVDIFHPEEFVDTDGTFYQNFQILTIKR